MGADVQQREPPTYEVVGEADRAVRVTVDQVDRVWLSAYGATGSCTVVLPIERARELLGCLQGAVAFAARTGPR